MIFNCWTEIKTKLGNRDNNYLNMMSIINILTSYEYFSNQINEHILLKRMLINNNQIIALKLFPKPQFLNSSHPIAIEYHLLLSKKESLENLIGNEKITNDNMNNLFTDFIDSNFLKKL